MAKTSFTMSFPRWYRVRLLSVMTAAATNLSVSFSYQIYGGLITQQMSCVVKGNKGDVKNYLRWVQELIDLNS